MKKKGPVRSPIFLSEWFELIYLYFFIEVFFCIFGYNGEVHI